MVGCRARRRDNHSRDVAITVWSRIPACDPACDHSDSGRCASWAGEHFGRIDAGARPRVYWLGSESGRSSGNDCSRLVACAGVRHSRCGLRRNRIAGRRANGDDVRCSLAFSSRVAEHAAAADERSSGIETSSATLLKGTCNEYRFSSEAQSHVLAFAGALEEGTRVPDVGCSKGFAAADF